jgi:hypothetical protein
MVELEHERIGLTAVDARVSAKGRNEIGDAIGDEGLFTTLRVSDVALAMRRIVLPFVGGSTAATVVVPLPPRPPMPGKSESGRSCRQRPQVLVEAGDALGTNVCSLATGRSTWRPCP